MATATSRRTRGERKSVTRSTTRSSTFTAAGGAGLARPEYDRMPAPAAGATAPAETAAAPGRAGFAAGSKFSYCSLPTTPLRELAPGVGGRRAELIRVNEGKWANGTVLHYYFFNKTTDGENVTLANGTQAWRTWTTKEAEKQVVRKAFAAWTDIGIGLKFVEVDDREDAEVRIGFMRGDGAWSYVGRDVLRQGKSDRTMNFGWDLTRDASEIDTAIHEIGHTLGFPHEHQNPFAGLVWDEEKVYAALAGFPNFWSREKTFHNIIRKISADTVQGSNWDPNSVMHYPFEPGLIKEPAMYRTGLTPAGGISERDKTWVRTFYPPLTGADYKEIKPFQSIPFAIAAGQQVNFTFAPTATRYYEMRTFGEADTVMALFEGEPAGQPRYMTADDDSGEERNAHIRTKLVKGRKYIIRVRLYYAQQTGNTAVMIW